MRKKTLLLILVFLLFFALLSFFGCQSKKSNTSPLKSVNRANKGNLESEIKNGVIVYYFHGSYRCPSCYKIEGYTQAAVDEFFNKERESGMLVYKTINVEEEGNMHFVKDYGLYTKSVVLSLKKGGREVKHKNLTKVWEYLDNKEKFYDYIKEETSNFLRELQERGQ